MELLLSESRGSDYHLHMVGRLGFGWAPLLGGPYRGRAVLPCVLGSEAAGTGQWAGFGGHSAVPTAFVVSEEACL